MNQQIKILKFIKYKFRLSRMGEIIHLERILNQRAKSRKFAKYEGLFFSKTLV